MNTFDEPDANSDIFAIAGMDLFMNLFILFLLISLKAPHWLNTSATGEAASGDSKSVLIITVDQGGMTARIDGSGKSVSAEQALADAVNTYKKQPVELIAVVYPPELPTRVNHQWLDAVQKQFEAEIQNDGVTIAVASLEDN